MPAAISEAKARRFAEALIRHGGNRIAAAQEFGYDIVGKGKASASVFALQMIRNPKVIEVLQPLAYKQLASLTPQAISTLQALLSTRSSAVRLGAARDILDRNGIGTSHEAPRSQQLVVNINLDPGQADAKQTLVLDAEPLNIVENATQQEQWSLDKDIAKPLSLDD